MALTINTSRALRSRAQLLGLVEAVLAAPRGEPETDALEWKSSWDLVDREAQFATARHVLGFGNRPLARSLQTFEGCAYLLAGVQPDELTGVARVDPAKLDDWLSRYVAAGEPTWSANYVSLRGKDVLVITVEPSRRGDRIRTLQRDFSPARAGTIYIRRGGKTVSASPPEIRMLEDRLLDTRPQVDLDVTLLEPHAPLQPMQAAQAEGDAWVQSEKDLALEVSTSTVCRSVLTPPGPGGHPSVGGS